MSITETILLILGILIFIVSFLIPAGGKKEQKESSGIKEEQIKELIHKEVEEAKTKIGDIVEETITYSMEKTERAMDRLTNEKMMAVNEYSDTVLEQINKNHKETVFLYDMLNDKHENLKQTVSEAAKTEAEVKQTVKDAEITAKEAREKAIEAKAQVMEATESIQAASEAMAESMEAEAEKIKESAVGEEFTEEEVSVPEETKEASVQETRKEEETDFTPIRAKRVEIIKEEVRKRESEEKSKKRTAKKPAEKTANTSSAVNAPVEKKAAKAELSMTASEGKGNKERILELHEAGKSNMAIAKELGLGIGEVKLVIDLFKGI